MKRMLYIVCALFLLAACDKDVHDEPKSGNGFLSVALVWEDKLNSTDEIESVNLWIYDKTGALSVDKKYASASDLALQKYEIRAGNVVVVIGVNVNEPIESQHTSTPEDLKYELARQCALYEMTFYGDKSAEAAGGESRAVYVPLHDRLQDSSAIDPDGGITDWEQGGEDSGELKNPGVLNSPAAGTIAANPALLDRCLDEEGRLVVAGSLNEEDLMALGGWAVLNAQDGVGDNDLVTLDLGATDITAIPVRMFCRAEIGGYEWVRAEYLAEVILPESVTTIGERAFGDCDGLQKVTCEGVERVDSGAFVGCNSLTTFKNSRAATLGDGAFGYTSLTNAVFDNVTQMGHSVFSHSEITNLRLGAKVVTEYTFFDSHFYGTIDLYACTEIEEYGFLNVRLYQGAILKLTAKENISHNFADSEFASTNEAILYLHENKKEGGTGTPAVEGETRWGGTSWKQIIFVNDAGEVVE